MKNIKILKLYSLGLVILALTLMNCSTKNEQKPLELTILNKEFYANCPAEECNSFEAFKKRDLKKYKNIVLFKITNNSRYNYIFTPFNLDDPNGTAHFFEFPKPHSGLSLTNIVLNGSIDSTHFVSIMGRMDEYTIETEEIVKDYRKKMNLKHENMDLYKSMVVNDNLLILPAKSTLYFKTYFSLPSNKTYSLSIPQEIILDKNKDYTAALYFRATATDILKYLNEGAKKTLEQDNFKLFDGELISTNQVPLIIKE